MKKDKMILLIILFTFIFSLFPIEYTDADTLNTNNYKYKWKEDSLINGSSQIEKTFYLSKNMDHSNFSISLKLKQSQTLIKDISSITILINNTKIHSIMLKDIGDDTLSIEIPKHLINTGKNSIKIEGFLKSTREKCELNDDINWIIVEKDSSFNFNYIIRDSVDIKTIFDNSYDSNGQVNIVLPNGLEKHNYSQIASLSALLGFVHKDSTENLDIKILKYPDLSKLDRESIIIGTPSQIKALDKKLLTDDEWEIAEKKGYIALRKEGLKKHFIIITSDESQLETLCKILGNSSSLSQIDGEDYVLDKSKTVSEKEFDSNPTLKSLGYDSLQKTGNGVKSFDYYFTIPARRTLSKDNKLTLVYSNSSLIDYEKAYVSVLINGENIITKDIFKDNTQNKLEFTIPEKYFDNVGFNISIKFNLKPDVETCISQTYDDIWVAVDSEKSNIDLRLKDRSEYSFVNSQGLLQQSNGILDGSIAVDKFENVSAYSISRISSYFGRVSQNVNKLIIEESTSENSYGAIFSLTTSPVIKDINEKLKIPVSDGSRFVNKELFIQNTDSIATTQVTQNNDKLVIIGTDLKQLNNSIQRYSQAVSNKDTIILKNDEVINYLDSDKEKLIKDGSLEKLKGKNEIIFALVLLLVTIILVFILYYKKVR